MTTEFKNKINNLLRCCDELNECAEPIYNPGGEVVEYAVPDEEYEAMVEALAAVGMKGVTV